MQEFKKQINTQNVVNLPIKSKLVREQKPVPVAIKKLCDQIVKSYRKRNVFDEQNNDREPEDTYFAW